MMSCAKIIILVTLVCYVTAKKHGYKYQAPEQQNSEQNYDPGYTNQPSPDYVEQNAEFYAFEAPYDAHEDVAHLEQQFASALQKNFRVVFIRAPENKALVGAFHALAKHTSEDKTAIYVLNKQNDASELAVKLSSLKSQHKSKPEVHFVKYKTQEEAVNAQRYIQEQYNQALPGAAHNYNGGTAPVLNFVSNYGGQREQGHEDSGFTGENGEGYDSQEPTAAQLNGSSGSVLNYGGQQELRHEDGFRGEDEQGYGLQKAPAHLPGTGNGALYAGAGDPSAYSGDVGDDDNAPVGPENDGYQYYPGGGNPSTYLDSYGVKHASNGLADAPAKNSPSQNSGKGFFGGAAASSPYRSGIPLKNGAYYAGAGIETAYPGAVNKGTQPVSQVKGYGPLYGVGKESDETDDGEFDAQNAYGISPRTKGTTQTLRVKDNYKNSQAYGISARTKGSSPTLRVKDDYNTSQAGISAQRRGFPQTDRVDFRINERQRRGPKMVFPKENTAQAQLSHFQRYKRKQKKY